MLTSVVLPQLGLEVSEGTVQAILVAVGDWVREGTVLAEVETDKAVTEIVAPRDGLVVAIDVGVGQTLPVGATLIAMGDSMADAPIPDVRGTSESNGRAGEAATGRGPSSMTGATHDAATEVRPEKRILAAPVARRAAAELNLSLEDIVGSGPNGRIVLADVERAAAARDERVASPGLSTLSPADQAEVSALPSTDEVEPLSPLRRVVATRMAASQLVPQFTLHRGVAFKWLLAEKERLPHVGVNDLIIHALADTVLHSPQLAMQFVDIDPPSHRRVPPDNVGLAIATPRGLLVAVIRHVHQLTLAEIASERKRLVATAQANRLTADEMIGATVTLSSLAGFGIDHFNAMLNPPEAAILAVGRTTDRLFAGSQGLVFGPMAELSMTFDHRVIDGAVGATALTHLVGLCEGEARWRM